MESLEGRLLLAADTDDQISEAIQLGNITSTPRRVDDTISPDTDVDMYRVQVSAGQTLDFDIDTVENGPGGLGSYIRLFDAEGNQLAANNDGAAPGENTIGFDAYLRYTFEQTGVYFLGVSNANNTAYDPITGENDAAGGEFAVGAYGLTVTALPMDEDDTFFRATGLGDITNGVATVDAEIDPDVDVDMYVFSVTNNQTVDFDIDTPLNGEGGLGSYLRLFNAEGQQIAFNDDGLAPGEATLGFDAYLRYTFENGGTYYLGVSNNNNVNYNPVTGGGDVGGGLHSIGAYRLTVQTPPPAPLDLDDTLSEAISLGTISTVATTRNGEIDPDVDVDMVRFTVNANQIVDIDIDTPLNGPGGLWSYLRLFDEQGNELAANDGAIAPGESVLGFDPYLRYRFDAAGTYYVGLSNSNNRTYDPQTGEGDVSGGPHATGAYQLTVQVLPEDPDDTLSTANFVGSISAAELRRSGRIDPDIDVDLYSFTATNGQVIQFDIDTPDNGPGGLGSYLRLFNADGQELAANDDGQGPGEPGLGFDAFLTYTFTSAGTYYIGVSNSTNTTYNPLTGDGDTAGGLHSIGDYTLVMVSPGPAPDDLDDTLGGARSLGTLSLVPIAISDDIDPDVDVDMFSFNVTAGMMVDFDIDTTTNGGDGLQSYVRLFDATGQLLAVNDDGQAPDEASLGFDAYLRHTFAIAGTYYLAVSNNTNTQFDPITGGNDLGGGNNSTGAYQLIVQAVESDPVGQPRLTLEFNVESIAADGGTALATVTRLDSDLSGPLTLNVTSSDMTLATVPAVVTMPAGENVVQFTINAVPSGLTGTRTVTITVAGEGFENQSRDLQIIGAALGGHNSELPEDVSGDSAVSPIDALLIINYLNQTGGGTSPDSGPPYLDVNNDGFVSPMDALLVINRLNNNNNNGEGEDRYGLDVATEEALKRRWAAAVDEIHGVRRPVFAVMS